MDTPTGTTLKALAQKVRIANTYGAVPSARITDDWQKTAHNYRVTLRYQRRAMTVDYFMGQLLTEEPTAGQVLESLLTDAEAGAVSFEDFCGDFGYDTDSRKAYRTWQACKRTTISLHRLLGSDFDTFASAERD